MVLSNIEIDRDFLSLPKIFYHEVNPTPLNEPHLIHFNSDLAKKLGLDLEKHTNEEIVKFVNGQMVDGIRPFAMCYAGHQFGFFVDRLGDGRAINLGVLNNQHLQLKGSGITRYSRDGDGRAVLRSSIREYLISEAMHGLGIPTTRALAIIGSNHRVYRESWESGAIVLRVSPSWIRFGTFEYFAHQKRYKELEMLMDYTIKESFPHLVGKEDAYIKMYEEVVYITAKLIAEWMAVGFNHGVMNTDNMSIAGLSIDYGPFAFLDSYNPNYICNHTDIEGRYSFKNQIQIGMWNLAALREALAPLISIDKMQEKLEQYPNIFNQHHLRLMRSKFGFDSEEEGDSELIEWFLNLLEQSEVDYTYIFRTLCNYNGDRKEIVEQFILKEPINIWLDRYDKRVERESLRQKDRSKKMKMINPKYILKNYMLQEVIDLAKRRDFSLINDLMTLAKRPFDEHLEFERYAKPTPKGFRGLKLSCSS